MKFKAVNLTQNIVMEAERKEIIAGHIAVNWADDHVLFYRDNILKIVWIDGNHYKVEGGN